MGTSRDASCRLRIGLRRRGLLIRRARPIVLNTACIQHITSRPTHHFLLSSGLLLLKRGALPFREVFRRRTSLVELVERDALRGATRLPLQTGFRFSLSLTLLLRRRLRWWGLP